MLAGGIKNDGVGKGGRAESRAHGKQDDRWAGLSSLGALWVVARWWAFLLITAGAAGGS